MCQLGSLMTQFGAIVQGGGMQITTTEDNEQSITSSGNALRTGVGVRLLINDRLYISSDALITPRVTDSTWASREAGAQVRAGSWVITR